MKASPIKAPSIKEKAKNSILPLVLQDVCFDINKQRLIKNFNLSFQPGTTSVILGPNGAGKSLILRLCHGLLKPTAGKILWQGQAKPKQTPLHAMVFQRPVMLRRSVAANIKYVLKVGKIPKSKWPQRLEESLEWADLSAIKSRSAKVLSIGEQQRLAMARAWVLRPQVLFLDEPTASLDPKATRRVETLMLEITKRGSKIILSTHNLGQARRIADEIIFIEGGRMIEQTQTNVFFKSPRSPLARKFLYEES